MGTPSEKSPIERKPIERKPVPPPPAYEEKPPIPIPQDNINNNGNGNGNGAARKSPSRSPKVSIDIGLAQRDFVGKLNTTDDIPSAELLRTVGKHVLLNKDGKSCSFRSLYTGPNVARRVLVIFVRHFFCGNCQEYLRALSEAITPDSLLRLPVSTFIAVVGPGDPKLIDEYIAVTNLQFPVYTDPSGALFKALGMIKTFDNGEKPGYFRQSMGKSVLSSVVQTVKHIPDGFAFKSGDLRQVGGEFLFEPHDIRTPTWSPSQGQGHNQQNGGGGGEGAHGTFGPLTKVQDRDEEKKVTWCHRMRTTRDHSEIPELMDILGLDRPKDGSLPGIGVRKGSGHTMADDIRKISAERAADQAARESPTQ